MNKFYFITYFKVEKINEFYCCNSDDNCSHIIYTHKSKQRNIINKNHCRIDSTTNSVCKKCFL